MSYKKYVETKTKSKISLDLQNYRENLQANLAKYLFLSDQTTNEMMSHIIDVDGIFENLSELKYPKFKEYIVALCSLNSKRINSVNSEFKEWIKNKNIDKTIFDDIQKEIYYYQLKLHTKQLTALDIDKIVDHAFIQSKNVLEDMCDKIQMALEQIAWKNHEISIEAIYPNEDLVVSEARIKIGDSHFVYEKLNYDFCVKEIHNLNEVVESLINKLKSNNYNSIVTLYLQRPVSERAYYEKTKRDLSLGIMATISNNQHLMNRPSLVENYDIWKIKIEKKYIARNKILQDDVPVKWIERINE